MAETYPKKSSGGCFSKLVFLVFLGMVAGLAYSFYKIAQPQDLSDLKSAMPARSQSANTSSNLQAVLNNSLQRGHVLRFNEIQLNRWLSQALKVKQGGQLAKYVSVNDIWVRLHEGYAEIILERTIFGKPWNSSIFITIDQQATADGIQTQVQLAGGKYHADIKQPLRGGKLGQLVVPQGFVLLVLPSYQKLAELLSEEIRLGFEEMARIDIKKGILSLNPRDDSDFKATF